MAGNWTRQGGTIVLEAPELESASDVIDPRIDVHAQFALRRMFKGGGDGAVDAAEMLAAVKNGVLAGIYKEDQKVAALHAQKIGLGWWQLIPKGEDAAVILDASIIVFRDSVRSNPARLDPALRKAWRSMRLALQGGCEVAQQAEFPGGALLANVLPPLLCQIPAPPDVPDSPEANDFVLAHRTRWCVPGQAGSTNCAPLTPPRSIFQVVIHTVATVSLPNLSGVQNVIGQWRQAASQGKETSAHYLVDRDGTITQMVREADVAFHVSASVNRTSVGIEHADVCNDPAPYTEQLYGRSAALVRDIARRHNVVVNFAGIVGHSSVGGHEDPGPYWDWEYYMALLLWDPADPGDRPRRFVSMAAEQARPPAQWQVRPRRTITHDHCALFTDPYGAKFWMAQPSKTGAAATFVFPLVFITGRYKVSIWYPKITGANSAVSIDVAVGCSSGTCAEATAQTVTIDQRTGFGQWFDIGVTFQVRTQPMVVTVRIRRDSPAKGFILADSVRLLKIAP